MFVRPAALVLASVAALASPAAAQSVSARRESEPPLHALYDAQGLGAGNLGFSVAAGFPYVQAEMGVGVARALDLDLAVDTLYGAATQISFGPKLRLFGDDTFAMALQLRGQWTAFRTSAFDETSNGARHVTGLRNWGLEPALLLSHRGATSSVFGEIRYQETYATEPDPSQPLSGGAPAWGENLGFYVGCEIGTASLVRFYGLLGADVHLRQGDFPVLPRAEVGIAFPG